MSGKTPGHATHDAWCADDDWATLSDAERAAWEDAAQAAIATQPDFTEHPVCDAHRWYAVVKHVGSFAYGFAAAEDGLRVYDDVDEFEYARKSDFG
jgi:hypothetical protein